MKPPHCRLCGHEHWTHEPHQWPSVAERIPVSRLPRSAVKTSGRPSVVTPVVTPAVTTPTPDPTPPLRRALTNAERQQRWRAAHPERSRSAAAARRQRAQQAAATVPLTTPACPGNPGGGAGEAATPLRFPTPPSSGLYSV